MKLAIPVKLKRENPPIAPLFGKAKWFAIVDGDSIDIIQNTQQGGRAVIEWLYRMGVEVLLIQEIGIAPYEMIKELGTMGIYYVGSERILLNSALEKFKRDELELLDDTNIDKILKHHERRHRHRVN